MIGKRGPQQVCFDTPVVPTPATRQARLLQTISGLIDFEPLRKQVEPYFASGGRPSIDPVVMIKMMLLGYLFGVPSDRQLVEECADRLSFREFLGYLCDESLPVHASFTHWRQRLGPEFFRDFLHEIVRQCQGQGLKLSSARTVDATRVKAQASRQGPLLEVPKDVSVQAYLDAYFSQDPPPPPAQAETIAVNAHDPDTRLQRREGEKAEFRYNASFAVDAESGLVTDATATVFEQPQTAVEHLQNDPAAVAELAADARYDDAKTLAQAQALGVTCYVAPGGGGGRTGELSKEHFVYDAAQDLYTCPAGKILRHSRYHVTRRAHFYVARQSDCQSCPLKAQCTSAKRRSVSRLDQQEARDQTVREGPRYRHLQRRRNINEHIHMLGKRDHGLARARSLGLAAMRIQAALTGMAINLKKLARSLGDLLSPPLRQQARRWLRRLQENKKPNQSPPLQNQANSKYQTQQARGY
jgi:transposase